MADCACQGCAASPGGPGKARQSSGVACEPIVATRITVPADGSASGTISLIAPFTPQLLGWEVQIIIGSLGTNSLLEARIDAFGAWQGNTNGLTWEGMRLNRGGRIYIPYPRADFRVVDSAAAAASAFSLYATPYQGDRPPVGATVLYGQDKQTTAATAATDVDIPAGAAWYRVMPAEANFTGNIRVEERSGGVLWLAYELDPTAAVTPGADPSGGWHRVPPRATSPVIRVINEDALNAADTVVLWRYDLTDVE